MPNKLPAESATTPPGDGRYPFSSLLLDSAGNLYGTTYKGGAAYGALFRFHP